MAVIGGSGDLGFGLALRLAVAGVPVVIGSRDRERGQQAAAKAGEIAHGQSHEADIAGLRNDDAASSARTVFLCVPFEAQIKTMRDLHDALQPSTVLVDATVPLATSIGGKPTWGLAVWCGSAAQQAQELAPRGVTVVSALHTVSAKSLADTGHKLDEDVLICGDEPPSKKAVADLLAKIPGLRPVDCGELEMARYSEQLTPLLISVNRRYKIGSSGIEVKGLPETLWE